MRRWLAVLLLLAWATPALATGKALVVRAFATQAGDQDDFPFWIGVFNTLGIDYRAVPHTRVQSYELRTGLYDDFGNGTSANAAQYDYIIVLHYRTNLGGGAGGLYANLDSLMTGAGWSNKPVLLMAPGTRNSLAMWADGAFDSSGFGAVNGTGVTTHEETSEYFGPDPQYSWRQAQGYSGYGAGPVPPGLFTALLKQNANPWYDYKKIDLSVPKWDSLRTGTDSLTLVRRYRVDASGNPTGAPLIICGQGYQLGSQQEGSLRRGICALAALDSAGGGTLLYQTRPGPVTFAAQIQVIGGSGRYTFSPADGIENHAGIFIPGGVDSGNADRLAAVFDSLQVHGVKASVGVQMNYDSTGTSSKPYYAQLVALRDRWPLAKVFPFELGGLGVLGSTTYAGANNDSTRNYDGFGAARLRSLLPTGYTGLIDTCHCGVDQFTATLDTTSVYCNLKRQRLTAEAFFGKNRVDKVWAAPFEDWSPLWFGKSAGSLDSLKWVLHKVGIKGLRVGVMTTANDAAGATGAPRGLFRSQSIEPVYDVSRWGSGGTGPSTAGGATTQKRAIGTMVFMPSRDSEAATNAIYMSRTGHDNPTEFLVGLFTGRWYQATPSPVYPGGGSVTHSFTQRTLLYEISGSWLSGSGDPLRQWKPGYWDLVMFKDWIDVVNRLAGRTVIQMGYGEDAAAWFVRSGLH